MFRCFLGLFIAFCGLAFAQNNNFPIVDDAYCGVYIKELSGDAVLSAYNHDKSFSPASVTKLITTATALEMLGADYRYETKLQYRGEIEKGVLLGDIIVKGGGDPTLGSKEFYKDKYAFLDKWVEDIAALNIKEIKGSILVDASIFDNQAIPNKWIWEDIGNYYGSGVYGLSCFDNSYDLYLSSSGVGELVKIDSMHPSCSKMNFESQVRGANSRSDNAYIYGSPWDFNRVVRGTIPAGRAAFKIKGALPNPPLFLSELFKEKLQENGIEVSGESDVIWQKSNDDFITISSMFSPALSEIVKITNKNSNNLYAEHLLKTLDVNKDDCANTKDALHKLTDFWKSKGISTDKIKIYDGSGLSRANLLTPEFVVSVIGYMYESENAEAFNNSLAVSGVDGTLKYFLDKTSLEGCVFGKSGSMSGVRCYAGVVEASDGKKYSFCIMMNNFTASHTKAIIAIEDYLLSVFK